MNPYLDKQTTEEYLAFLESENGRIQQEVLSKAITERLPQNKAMRILDAACGSGWLTDYLAAQYDYVTGCDHATKLIEHAQAQHPQTTFTVADVQKPLPYEAASFDVVILNMAATDLAHLSDTYHNLNTVLKPGGQLLVTIPNPLYAYPSGIWKRSWLDFILFRKPQLYLRSIPYNPHELLPSWNSATPTSRHYSLEDHINAVTNSGFALTHFKEIRSETDSNHFNLRYTLHRYPLLLLLEFRKTV